MCKKGLLVTLVFLELTVAQFARANPASDRAFGNCVTAAAAYLQNHGYRIGAITLLTRDAHQYRLHITAAESNATPAAIVCSSSRTTTAIEWVSMRQVVSK